MAELNLHKLFSDVFHPEPDECIAVIMDVPTDETADHGAWEERRKMAQEWHSAWVSLSEEIGFDVLPLISFPASGAHNANLPLDEGDPITLRDALTRSTLVLALTEFSATAPLSAWAKGKDDFRAASLPQVAKRMEKTALSADYSVVAERCKKIKELLNLAEFADVVFSTGHRWRVDLRFRDAQMDDGQLPRRKQGKRIINLPSGESFKVPYEGEKAGWLSETNGEVPVALDDARVLFQIERNRIVNVTGEEPAAGNLRVFFEVDPMRRNIAELAVGCNANAVVWGNVLEDEKAGFHWAYGRSEHLGGVIAPEDFAGPEFIVHQDIVYAQDSPIQVTSLILTDGEGETHPVIVDGKQLF